MIRTRSLALIPALILTAVGVAQAQDAETPTDTTAATDAATEAALAWLALVDADEIEESWEAAAGPFQDAVTPASWRASVEDARAPFEPFGERTLLTRRYVVDLPGAPPGEYVMIQFRTKVAKGGTVVETIVPMKENGEWKVSGYFVRPE